MPSFSYRIRFLLPPYQCLCHLASHGLVGLLLACNCVGVSIAGYPILPTLMYSTYGITISPKIKVPSAYHYLILWGPRPLIRLGAPGSPVGNMLCFGTPIHISFYGLIADTGAR